MYQDFFMDPQIFHVNTGQLIIQIQFILTISNKTTKEDIGCDSLRLSKSRVFCNAKTVIHPPSLMWTRACDISNGKVVKIKLKTAFIYHLTVVPQTIVDM